MCQNINNKKKKKDATLSTVHKANNLGQKKKKKKKKLFGCPPPSAPNFGKLKKVFIVQTYTAQLYSEFHEKELFFPWEFWQIF